jgi:capsular polysaccharide biosynthesis protein
VNNEREVLDLLEPLGFVTIDPGRMGVQEQIDHFAAAEVVVAPHGAALTNLNFCSPGVRILELFAPGYLNPGYWTIADNLPDATYRYLVGRGADPGPGSAMNGVMHDITVDPRQLARSLDELLGK